MKKIILIFLLLIPIAFADVSEITQTFNAEVAGEELTGLVAILFGNERINFYIDEITISVITKDGKIGPASEGILENPTLNVYTSEATIKEISESENSLLALKEALDNNDITFEVVGFLRKIKFWILMLIAELAGGLV